MSLHIPDKVVNRLTLYHFILDDLDQDEKYISSSKISQLLNIDNSQVRAGNLGSALAKYSKFRDYGLNILAMFDVDKSKIGTLIDGKEVFEISKISDLVQKLRVDIAILTVPKSSAQEIADFLVDVGIKYIWNFTPCILDVPKTVKVRNENLIGSFLRFTNNVEAIEIRNDD